MGVCVGGGGERGGRETRSGERRRSYKTKGGGKMLSREEKEGK